MRHIAAPESVIKIWEQKCKAGIRLPIDCKIIYAIGLIKTKKFEEHNVADSLCNLLLVPTTKEEKDKRWSQQST